MTNRKMYCTSDDGNRYMISPARLEKGYLRVRTPADESLALRALSGSPNARVPGDWPVDLAHVPLWSFSPEFDT